MDDYIRRRSTRTLLIAGAFLSLCGPATVESGKPSNKGGGPSYEVVKLDDIDGTIEGFAYDVNDSRLVVGIAQDYITNAQVACCWSVVKSKRTYQSTLQLLDSSQLVQSQAKGCNEAGEIVGSGLDASGDALAIYWAGRNELAQPLPTPPGDAPYGAAAISIDGVICGNSVTVPGEETSALVWRVTPDGVWGPLELEALDPDPSGADYVVANDVCDQDADGVITIAGQSNGNAVIWTVTLSNEGGLLAGPSSILSSDANAHAINNVGIVCGNAAFAPNKAAAWIDGIPMILDPGQSPYSATPYDVNGSGVIVGASVLQGEAVVWPSPADAMISLNKFLKNSPFDSLTSGEAVNTSGDIVGYGVINNLGFHPAFLAIPK